MFKSRPTEPEWVSWVYVVAWTGVIYATVPLARTIQEWTANTFGGREIFTWLTLAAAIIGTLTAIRLVVKLHGAAAWKRLAWLFGIGAIFVYWTMKLKDAPEEALHFVEYGLLGFLLFRALIHRITNWTIYLCAVLAGCLIGTVDEVIQWITPERFWDWRDVRLNTAAVALVQTAIAMGIAPPLIHGKSSSTSLRLTYRLSIAVLLLFALCLMTTPARVERLATAIPKLDFLQGNGSVISEYGYSLRDPEAGVFKSRYSPEELARQDRKRGREAATILDRYRDPRKCKQCLKDYPSHIDPLVHEARVRLWSMFHHVGMLWIDGLDKPMGLNMNSAEIRSHCTSAYNEHLIMARYFPNTYTNSHYRVAKGQLEAIRQGGITDGTYRSKVSRHLITFVTQSQAVATLFVLIVILALVDFLSGRTELSHEKENTPERTQ